MSVEGGVAQPGSTPSLPRSIWVVAWASLIGQVVLLVWNGAKDDNELSLVASVILGALVVGYVSAGVIRARTIRVVVAYIVLGLSLMGETVALVTLDEPAETPFALLSMMSTVVALAGLVAFCQTDWYAWQRTRPSGADHAPYGRLVLIGVLVGVLGGLSEPVDNGFEVRIGGADQ